MTNYIRAFLVLFFFGLLTACGSGGGGNTAMTMTPPPVTPPPPVTLALESPEIGAFHYRSLGGGVDNFWFVVLSVAEDGANPVVFGQTLTLTRLSIYAISDEADGAHLPTLNRASFHANGDIVPLVENGATVSLTQFGGLVAFETIQSITTIAQLCPVSFLATYIDANFPTVNCPGASQLSYSPDMRRVVHAAMADTFHSGLAIGESNFAFSGRHNGDDRAAGFTYDMGSFALRTDYVHLPSKQDSGVWLDTYRFGILQSINDETRFFAGVDSYRNAILAIDTNGENLHRFGIAAGDGYALQYELRIRL